MPLLSGTDDCSGNSGDMSQNTKRVLVTAGGGGGAGVGGRKKKKEDLCTNCYRTIYWMDEMRDWVNLSTLPADVWPDVCTLKLPTESQLVFQHFMKSVQMQHSQ